MISCATPHAAARNSSHVLRHNARCSTSDPARLGSLPACPGQRAHRPASPWRRYSYTAQRRTLPATRTWRGQRAARLRRGSARPRRRMGNAPERSRGRSVAAQRATCDAFGRAKGQRAPEASVCRANAAPVRLRHVRSPGAQRTDGRAPPRAPTKGRSIHRPARALEPCGAERACAQHRADAVARGWRV